MDLGITGRVAIVGGSSKGMGKATALALAREGVNVTICARHSDQLERTAAEIGAATSSQQVLAVVADLSKQADIERLVADTTRRWGQVDIVVNNVGGPPPGLAAEMTDEQWHDGFELTFFSAVRLSHLVIPVMRQRKWGRIINLLSMAIKEPEDNLAISTVARTAVAAYAKILALEVAKDGITVNNVLPGSIETDRLQVVAEMQARFHGRDPAHGMDDRRGHVAAGRFGRPEEMADLISFLASERGGFITGTSVLIDGGQIRAVT
jgi:3-oxoacyl-[acyl-carrier protein] reductase